MRLLLDTHIWVWSQAAPEKIARGVERALRDPKAELWLSPISVWEFLLLAEKGKIALNAEPRSWVDESLKRAPLNEAPLTHEIAVESRHVDLSHPDPADRFLVATARVLDLALVTADQRLLSTKSCRVLKNRV